MSRAWRGRALAVAVLSFLFLVPLAFMILGSIRTPGLPPPDGFEVVPSEIRWANYETVFQLIPMRQMLINSLVIVAIAVPVTVLVASWAGYTIATARPRTQKRLIIISLVALMVPATALWVPRFVMFRWAGLTDTIWPLVAPALMATTPFYVLIFAFAYWRIPKELYEAARVEGLSDAGIWRKVAFPLAKPAAFAVAVLAFVFHWSNFIDPLLYISTEQRATASLGLRTLQTLEPTLHPILLAAAVIVTIPPVIAFLLAQRAFFTKTLEV